MTIRDDRCHPQGSRLIAFQTTTRLLRGLLTSAPAIALVGSALAAALSEADSDPAIAAESAPFGELAHWRDALVGPRLDGIGDTEGLSRPSVVVGTVAELQAAVRTAAPGTVIEIEPGRYDFSGGKIEVDSPGLSHSRITLRAPALGSVRLRFSLLEGFHVLAPYWTFENLFIEGTCRSDSDCEHAFHVVGDAVGVVIQNNWVVDFNAAVKVNGKSGRYPDDGVIRHNTFINSRPRNTDRPVTMLDLVSVSRWRIQKNVIADFAKMGGNHTSYGAFFKGAGEDNVFEQNLVRCEARHSGLYRIGFSFGDGGTGRRFCRDGGCAVEHRRGIARNNVIMNCPNRAGIYLHKSAETLLHNNALIDTGGIALAGTATHAVVLNNILDGGLWAHDGAEYLAARNVTSVPDAAPSGIDSDSLYVNAIHGDLRLRNSGAIVGRGVPVGGKWPDLCGQFPDEAAPDIGPIQYSVGSSCVPRLW